MNFQGVYLFSFRIALTGRSGAFQEGVGRKPEANPGNESDERLKTGSFEDFLRLDQERIEFGCNPSVTSTVVFQQHLHLID